MGIVENDGNEYGGSYARLDAVLKLFKQKGKYIVSVSGHDVPPDIDKAGVLREMPINGGMDYVVDGLTNAERLGRDLYRSTGRRAGISMHQEGMPGALTHSNACLAITEAENRKEEYHVHQPETRECGGI